MENWILESSFFVLQTLPMYTLDTIYQGQSAVGSALWRQMTVVCLVVVYMIVYTIVYLIDFLIMKYINHLEC